MKRTLLTTFLLVAAVTVCIAQEHKERAPHVDVPLAPSIPAGWIRYKSSEGRYNISLPVQPTLTTQPSKTADGVSFLQYMAASSNDRVACLVGYFDRTPGSTFSFDKARDGFVGAVNGTLISEAPITFQGQPGRQLRVEGRGTDGVTYVLRVRIYDMVNRIYVVQFIAGKSDADAPGITRDASQYFDSFSVSQ